MRAMIMSGSKEIPRAEPNQGSGHFDTFDGTVGVRSGIKWRDPKAHNPPPKKEENKITPE